MNTPHDPTATPTATIGKQVLTSPEFAEILGVTRHMLWRWRTEDAVLAACILRQTKRSTWWSVARLRQRGYLA